MADLDGAIARIEHALGHLETFVIHQPSARLDLTEALQKLRELKAELDQGQTTTAEFVETLSVPVDLLMENNRFIRQWDREGTLGALAQIVHVARCIDRHVYPPTRLHLN